MKKLFSLGLLSCASWLLQTWCNAAVLPFSYKFAEAGADGFTTDWKVQDKNGDESTWTYSEWVQGPDGEWGVASCTGSWQGDFIGDDYLITAQPFHLKPGFHHLSFSLKSVSTDYVESLGVCFGLTDNGSDMTVASEFSVNSTQWLARGVNIDVAEEGDYFIGFHAHSDNGLNVFIDNIHFSEGYQELLPQLTIVQALLPHSSCDLSCETPVGLRLVNYGAGTATSFEATCSVNSREIATQTFNVAVEPMESIDVYFDSYVDCSEVGSYNVALSVATPNGNTSTIEEVLSNYEPVTSLPITTNFTEQTNMEFWDEMMPGTWIYDDWMGEYGSSVTGIDNGLLSHCVRLDSSVRLKLKYAKGGWDNCSMFVAFGKAGVNPEYYKRVYEDPDCSGNEAEVTIDVTDADDYNFLIATESDDPTARVSFYLYECDITPICDHDLRITEASAPLSYLTPVDQIAGIHTFYATVENRGTSTMTGVKLSLWVNGQVVATGDNGVDMVPGSASTLTVTGELPTVSVGDCLHVSVEAVANEADILDIDNRYDYYEVWASATTRATEDIDAIVYGTGSWWGPINMGNVYTIDRTDALTSVDVGFSETYEGDAVSMHNVGFALHRLNDDGTTLENCLYSTEFVRGIGGLVTVEFDPILLTPGKYLFEIRQLDSNNIGLAYDDANGEMLCYETVDGVVKPVEGASLVIRAEFDDAEPLEKDAMVRAITSPSRLSGLYSDKEVVQATLRNNGYSDADIAVSCSVNGAILSTSQLHLAPYQDEIVEFPPVDMSSAGTYTISVIAELADDQKTSNNELTITCQADEERSPYCLDFESTQDFDASTEIWNPRWRTIDRNAIPTTYFWRYEHAHRGEAVGFISFNPDATLPSMIDDGFVGFYPHSGSRFGTAFCFDPYEAADWQTDVTNSDVWLISPQLKLDSNSVLKLWVKTRDLESFNAELEPYSLLISDTDDDFDSFTPLGEATRYAPVDEWELVEESLSSFDGKNVYVAVRYTGKPFVNTALMIDDISVETDGAVSAIDDSRIDSSVTMRYDEATDVLTISSTIDIEQIDVYGIDARCVYSATGCQRECSIVGLPKGVCVVLVRSAAGTIARKVAI